MLHIDGCQAGVCTCDSTSTTTIDQLKISLAYDTSHSSSFRWKLKCFTDFVASMTTTMTPTSSKKSEISSLHPNRDRTNNKLECVCVLCVGFCVYKSFSRHPIFHSLHTIAVLFHIVRNISESIVSVVYSGVNQICIHNCCF